MLPYLRMSEEEPSSETCRKKTDVHFLYGMAMFMFLMTIGIIYASTTADMNRLLKRHDDCGNICGIFNALPPTPTCVDRNMTNKPYLHQDISSLESKCVESCDSSSLKMPDCSEEGGEDENEAKSEKFMNSLMVELDVIKGRMILMTFVSLALIGIMILLFRYYTKQFVYTLYGLIVAVCLLGFVFTFIQFGLTGSDFLWHAFCQIIGYIIVLVVLFVVYKRLPLVIRLFYEASRAIGDMPFLLIQPLVTLIVVLILSALSILFSLMFLSAGSYDEETKTFAPDGLTIASMVLFVFGFHWLVFFALALQHMIVGGAVTSWYFTTDKYTLKKPISSAIRTTFMYHLGTLALGSLVAVFICILKRIIYAMRKRNYCCFFILERIEEILRYMSKIAYIMTIMHGVSFIDGGKRAVSLLKKNFMATLTVNTTSGFIIRIAQLLLFVIVFTSSFFLYDNSGIKNAIIFATITGFISIIFSDVFFIVYDTAIDALFLCYCEDMEENDGDAKPYYSSTVLVSLIQDSKKA